VNERLCDAVGGWYAVATGVRRAKAAAVLFYKLVAAIAGVGLGLTCSDERRGFYERHGFVRAGRKRFYSPARGEHFTSPGYRLEHNEVAAGSDQDRDRTQEGHGS